MGERRPDKSGRVATSPITPYKKKNMQNKNIKHLNENKDLS